MARSTNPFRYFDSSPELIRFVVLMYVEYPLSLRNEADLLAERGIDICHETVRHEDADEAAQMPEGHHDRRTARLQAPHEGAGQS